MRFLVLLLAVVLARASFAQSTPPARPIQVEPCTFGALTITPEMQQLWVVYGPCRQKLEEKKLERIVERELARRAAKTAERRLAERGPAAPSGAERDALLRSFVDDELERLRAHAYDVEGEVELAYQAALADFEKRATGLSAEVEMRRSFRDPSWFRSQLRWGAVFERVFLPADENARPEATVNALRARFRTEYETWRKPWRLPDGNVDPQYAEMTRQVVRDFLFEEEHFTTSLEGPDFSKAITAEPRDGTPPWSLTTKDAWNSVVATVDPAELELARRYWTTVLATRAALKERGLVLEAAERKNAFDALSKQLQEFVPSLEAFAVQQQRFPSPETFFESYALTCTFQKEHAKRMADGTPTKPAKALLEHVAHANGRRGGVRANAEVLLVSAWDFANARWKDGGFDAARRRAEALRDRVRANERAWGEKSTSGQDPAAFWSALLDEASEWWDPPSAPNLPVDPTVRPKNHGRFGALEYSELLETLETSRYDLWTSGAELVDAVYFDAESGAVVGPFPHRYGYALVRVVSRTPPQRALDPADPRQRDAIEVDFLDDAFRAFSRAAVDAARTKPARAPGDAAK